MSSNGQEIFIVNEFSKKHSPQADTSHKLFLKVLENILASISESSLDLSYADKHEEGTAIKQASKLKQKVSAICLDDTQKGSFHSSCPTIGRGSLILLHKLFFLAGEHTREVDFTLLL